MDNQKYQSISSIGQGSYGEVYAAFDQENNIVAIKKLKNKSKSGVSFTSLREIKILKEYIHENIINLVDIELSENAIFLVLEYCCSDLQEIISFLDI